jgi:hypothetical protein
MGSTLLCNQETKTGKPKTGSKSRRKKGIMAKKVKSKKAKAKKISKSALVAAPSNISTEANVNCVFRSGIGQITASLFRRGVLINMQSISSSGDIHFAEVQSGDVISINGVCTGTADISIDVSTTPSTPQHFNSGLILAGYLIN